MIPAQAAVCAWWSLPDVAGLELAAACRIAMAVGIWLDTEPLLIWLYPHYIEAVETRNAALAFQIRAIATGQGCYGIVGRIKNFEN